MKPVMIAVGTISVAVLSVAGIAALSPPAKEVCVARPPLTNTEGIGYELIDVLRRAAWVTTDWTPKAYTAFTPGLTSLNWVKNDPRAGYAAQVSVLRSPGCKTDGAFTYQSRFGRTFFHMADITSMGRRYGPRGEILEVSVTKHHRLHFDSGQSVSILVSEQGQQFVRVNRSVLAPKDAPDIPDGWSLLDVTLDRPWQVDLFDKVRVLRLNDGTSYQGPVGNVPGIAAQVAPDGLQAEGDAA